MNWLPLPPPSDRAQAYAWAMRQSAAVRNLDRYADRYRAEEADSAWQQVEARYGVSATTRHERAKVLSEMARYQAAAEFERQAGHMREARKYSELASVQKRVAGELHRNALRVVRAGVGQYLVLFSHFGEGAEFTRGGLWFAEMDTSRSRLKVSSLTNLNYQDMSDESTAQLLVRDLDKDGRREILVHQIFPGGSWTPSMADILVRKHGHWKIAASLFSHDPLILQEPSRGPARISQVFPLGGSLAHSDMPMCMQTYVWQGHLRFVNSRYPARNRRLLREIREVMIGHPQCREDADVWHYKAQAERCLGMTQRARHSERRARQTGWRFDYGDLDYLNSRKLRQW